MIKAFAIILIFVACQAQSQPLTIGTAPIFPPSVFLDSNGVLQGFDIDFLASAASVAGIQYEIVQTSWEDLFAAVLNSTFDLAISTITINDARREIYDFSVPYFLSTHEILAKEGTTITNAQSLIGRVVGVIAGTTGAAAILKLFGGDATNIREFPGTDAAFPALVNGEIEAYVNDNANIQYLANTNPGYVVISDPSYFEKELYGMMFPKGSPFKAQFDPAITQVLADGTYTTIYTQWFGASPDVNLLLEAGQYENPYDVFNEGGTEVTEVGETETGESRILMDIWDMMDLIDIDLDP